MSKRTRKFLIIGLVMVSLAGLVFQPLSELADRVVGAAPWVAIGITISEALFIGGLVMAALSFGMKLGNPFALRGRTKQLLLDAAKRSGGSKLFWLGFGLNAAGAVGTSLVAIAGVVSAFPVQSWPLAVPFCLDEFATLALRRLIMTAIHEAESVD